MLPYWLLFFYFALGGLLGRSAFRAAVPVNGNAAMPEAGGNEPSAAPRAHLRRGGVGLLFGMLLVALMVGLRYRVGADWQTYEAIFSRADLGSFGSSISRGDWGYQLVNALIAKSGGAVWQVNLVCSSLFAWGLWRFAERQPDPWLVIVVAVPYLIVVVAMGYSRQAAALGILMAGLAAVLRGSEIFRFALYVLVAALFHRTAIVLLPLMGFVFPRSRASNVLLLLALSISLYTVFLQDSVEVLRTNYVDARYSSQGAGIRVAQVALAAIIYFAARRRFGFDEVERRIWRNFAVVGLLMVPVLALTPSSTAVDRISLYLFPLQLAVIGRLHLAFRREALGRLVVVGYSAAVLFVWLNFAVHAQFWLPYRNVVTSDRVR
ncbi:EpsG family protein [Sphingomonas astaxanthinifaciens]|uniref:EpsG family protein n=1 Tax=Sphingomonas astaxanthinifaciens DSM 22298 TaxID=1123267 RepID=A0ABQ5Z2H4_9SPHN|nr:EpsG family protein [Sphingomonas astaxanthinifaciens]GLR46979.1 hypothetical protein GCM10007925_06900 [Sphingomonas astaxanthinifaciens DSM 22298]